MSIGNTVVDGGDMYEVDHPDSYCTDDHTVKVSVEALQQLQEKINRLEAERDRNQHLRDSTRERNLTEAEKRKRESQALEIGGSEGVHPDEFDIRIEETVANGKKRHIAWVPCLLFTEPQQSEKRPYYEYTDKRTGTVKKIPQYVVGQTTIRASNCSFPIYHNDKTQEVSARGFLVLNLDTRSPEKKQEYNDNARRIGINWADADADPADPSSEVEGPPFIGYQQPTQRETSPTSNHTSLHDNH